MFRFAVFENFTNNEYTLVLLFHHIILDETQFDKIIKELEYFYQANTKSNIDDNESIVELEKYLEWEKEQISKADFESSREYFLENNTPPNLPYSKRTRKDDRFEITPVLTIL